MKYPFLPAVQEKQQQWSGPGGADACNYSEQLREKYSSAGAGLDNTNGPVQTVQPPRKRCSSGQLRKMNGAQQEKKPGEWNNSGQGKDCA